MRQGITTYNHHYRYAPHEDDEPHHGLLEIPKVVRALQAYARQHRIVDGRVIALAQARP